MSLDYIPTGSCREDVYIRRDIIVKYLSPLIGKSIPCNAFNGKDVEILFHSVDETATRASQRYESTLAALRLEEALRHSSFVKTDLPNHKQKMTMYFSKMHELVATLENLGDVKIIVGERNNKRIDNSLLYYKKEKRVAEMSSITIGSYRLPLKSRLQMYEYFL